jgi:hypothetical protein
VDTGGGGSGITPLGDMRSYIMVSGVVILVPFIIKGAKRDQISHHGWSMLDAGQHAYHPIMCLDLNGANALNLTWSIISHTHKISRLHKFI